MNQTVSNYIPIVDFIYCFVGRNCEIVLYDFTLEFDHSIIAIKNGHVSGRKVGGATTQIAINAIKNNKFPKEDISINYYTKTKDGLPIKAVCYVIREDAQPVGMLCVNVDDTLMLDLDNIINSLKNQNKIIITEDLKVDISSITNSEHSLNRTTGEYIVSEISAYFIENNIDSYTLSQEQRMEIIKDLHLQGCFLKKGSVSETAALLYISQPSVYRYIQNIRKEDH